MSRLEYLTCRVMHADTNREAPPDGILFCRRAGWSLAAIENYRSRFGNFGKQIHPLPDSFSRLQNGDVHQWGDHAWQVIVTSGHSPEHVCLYCPDLRLLISGDQVLPRISSNVSVYANEPHANPLKEWFDSLDILQRQVPGDVLVLPSHNAPFYGLHERLQSLRAGSTEALERLCQQMRGGPQRIVDVFPALFRRAIGEQDGQQLSLATGEAVAYMNYLIAARSVQCNVDGDGVAWYSLAP